jgi:pimeloyl-ACP methyl ester carboxylesterase
MPTIKVNGIELFYKESGSGPETIVFSHGLLMDHTMFEPQRAAFEKRYRVIAYDHRGQGQSPDPGYGHDMDMLAKDAATLIQALNVGPCHFAGLSMGGFVGMRLASRRRELVKTLTLMNTGADPEPKRSRREYGFLAQLSRFVGLRPFVGTAMKALFGRSARESNDPATQAMLAEWRAKLGSRPKNIVNSLLAVMNRPKFSADDLALIRCPTLVIAGAEDTAQPPFRGERVASAIPNARMVTIPGCGHSSSLEAPEAVISAMQELVGSAAAAGS